MPLALRLNDMLGLSAGHSDPVQLKERIPLCQRLRRVGYCGPPRAVGSDNLGDERLVRGWT
jgi:hypothetical protein